jgi:release factor glutamine methyltransferase
MATAGQSASEASNEVWTIDAILRWTQAYFGRHHLPTARLDAEVLLAHALQCNRVRLYTHFDQPLSAPERDAFRGLVKRRAAYEPVAYICGQREFYGRDFSVDPSVLIPRPETEHVVEAALAWAKEHPIERLRILDVGSGSGALAVTLAAELAHATVVAADLSEQALDKTRQNAERHGVAERMQYVHGDLLAQVQGNFDIIVSNPPYIAEDERAELAPDVVRYEPSLALFAGDDGLQIIARLARDVRLHLCKPGIFLCEIGHRQGPAARTLMQAGDFWHSVDVLPDLQGHARVVVARC